MEHDAIGKALLQADEKILVVRLAAAERDQTHVTGGEKVRQRIEQQVETFLHRHARHDADQRRAVAH
jgi:hypothetical protein